MKPDDLNLFSEAELLTYDLELLPLNGPQALSSLKQQLAQDLDELQREDVCVSRWRHYQIEGTSPEDYAERMFDGGHGEKILAGIRHFSGDRNSSFIQLRANFRINNKQHALRLYEKLEPHFKMFKPKELCFFSKSSLEVDRLGSITYAASAKTLRELKPWPLEHSIELRKVEDESYYDWYHQSYSIFHSDFPHLRLSVAVNSLESMKNALEQGLIYEAYCGDQKVGLIAAERGDFVGSPGLMFMDILVSKEWKGRGLAKAMQRKFVNIASQEQDVIWGTIDWDNHASQKTALANGRQPIRYECFVCIQ